MKAIQATKFGGPEVLEIVEVPEPKAGAGQVLIEVSVAEILFLDTMLRDGQGQDYFDLDLPYIPGVGVAGEIVSVGDGVDSGWIGRRVIASTSGGGAYSGGGYAERTVARIAEIYEIPDGLKYRQAIAALSDGFMATSRMDHADIQPRERVLINAAAGGIGIWLIPLAKAAGARIIAAARGERKLENARKLGADTLVDYSEDGWTEKVREATGGAGVDVVFDGAGGRAGAESFEAIATGGRFFVYGSAGGFAEPDAQDVERRKVEVIGGVGEAIKPEYKRRMIEKALSELVAGRIKSVIGQAVPLGRAAEAHAAIEAREITGKSLLVIKSISPFTQIELDYMATQKLGRLATAQSDGTLQNSPVGFRYDPDSGTIDIWDTRWRRAASSATSRRTGA